jgi:indole-3-acetate monooxygenase
MNTNTSINTTNSIPFSSESLPTASIARQLLVGIRELAPAIAARASEFENARRIPSDAIEALKAIGVFRIFVPQSHGGLELDLPAGLEIIAALSRIDGSVGWIGMVNSGGSIFAPRLPRPAYDRVYQNGPDVMLAGSTQPMGTAEATADGLRVNGRWPFASGCRHADWMVGLCVMTEGGKPLLGEGGQPQIRGATLPAHEWQIEDTWYAAGLKGTGSDHIALKDKLVPAENFLDIGRSPCLPGPLYQVVLPFLPLLHSAVAVGIAEGAMDDLLAFADSGRQQMRAAGPMRESETFHFELGRVAAELRAARALLQVQAWSHWRHAISGTLNDEAVSAQGTQAGIWITRACVRVADACFALAGGSAVYDSSPLQRRLRDLHAAAQHVNVQQRHYAIGGKVAVEQFGDRFDDDRRLIA